MAFITEIPEADSSSSSAIVPQAHEVPQDTIADDSNAVVPSASPQWANVSEDLRVYRQITGTSRFPLELQVIVIDRVAAHLTAYGFGSQELQSTLLACMLVCHSWLHHAKQYLYCNIYHIPTKHNFSSLKAALKNNPVSARSIRTLLIALPYEGISLSAFLISQQLPNLQCLRIGYLDLTRESTWVYKAAACLNTVHYLHLSYLKPCTAAQLTKFVNSFHSLSRLHIHFHLDILEVKSQPLSKPCKLSTSSLTTLVIRLIPGISTLLGWFVRTNSWVANLKQLTLCLSNEDMHGLCCQGVAELLDHCSHALQELTLVTSASMTNKHLELFPLSKLSKLQRLTYQSSNISFDQAWAINQLKQIPSTNSLAEICFNVYQGWDTYWVEHKWKVIDSILIGDKFKSLQRVLISTEEYLQHLPQLDAKGILKLYGTS